VDETKNSVGYLSEDVVDTATEPASPLDNGPMNKSEEGTIPLRTKDMWMIKYKINRCLNHASYPETVTLYSEDIANYPRRRSLPIHRETGLERDSQELWALSPSS
jgi:hypothetical protein